MHQQRRMNGYRKKKHKWNTKSINLPKKLKTLHKKQTKIEMWEARNIKQIQIKMEYYCEKRKKEGKKA